MLSFKVRSDPVLVFNPENAEPGALMKLMQAQNAFVLKLWGVRDRVASFWS